MRTEQLERYKNRRSERHKEKRRLEPHNEHYKHTKGREDEDETSNKDETST
jgi:hypothetical protein